ncbi:MAG: hypothetical protein AAB393_11865, partial [Bacteroidota bacterium]
GTVVYSSSGATNVAPTTYYYVNFENGQTYTLTATTTASATTTIAGGTLAVGNNLFNADGAIDNTGRMTRTSGVIAHVSEMTKITNGSGLEISTTIANGSQIFITVKDLNRNMEGATIETVTATFSGSASAGGDRELVYLTETATSSGIFRNISGVPVANGYSALNDGRVNIGGAGLVYAMYEDQQNLTDTGSDNVAATYADEGGGGGGGGGGSSGGGGGGGSSGTPYVPPSALISTPAPVVTPPVIVLTPTPVVIPEKTVTPPPVVPTSTTVVVLPQPVVPKTVTINLSQIPSIRSGQAMTYTYSVKNETTKILRATVVRQLISSKGKALRTWSANIALKPKAMFSKKTSDKVTSPVVTYLVRIEVRDSKT